MQRRVQQLGLFVSEIYAYFGESVGQVPTSSAETSRDGADGAFEFQLRIAAGGVSTIDNIKLTPTSVLIDQTIHIQVSSPSNIACCSPAEVPDSIGPNTVAPRLLPGKCRISSAVNFFANQADSF